MYLLCECGLAGRVCVGAVACAGLFACGICGFSPSEYLVKTVSLMCSVSVLVTSLDIVCSLCL